MPCNAETVIQLLSSRSLSKLQLIDQRGEEDGNYFTNHHSCFHNSHVEFNRCKYYISRHLSGTSWAALRGIFRKIREIDCRFFPPAKGSNIAACRCSIYRPGSCYLLVYVAVYNRPTTSLHVHTECTHGDSTKFRCSTIRRGVLRKFKIPLTMLPYSHIRYVLLHVRMAKRERKTIHDTYTSTRRRIRTRAHGGTYLNRGGKSSMWATGEGYFFAAASSNSYLFNQWGLADCYRVMKYWLGTWQFSRTTEKHERGRAV